MKVIDPSKFEELKATGQLPSPQGVALAVLRLARKPEVSMDEIVRVIKADPALSGRIIKAANSAAFARQRPVAGIPDALTVLGLRAVCQLALGFSLLSNYHGGRCENFDYSGFWSRSLATAVAAQALTLRTHVAPPEEVFVLGLLCGVGRLALATLYPMQYSEILAKAQREGIDLVDLERATFATDHLELACALLRDWGFPQVLVDPVLHHERPEAADFPEGSRGYLLVHGLAAAARIAQSIAMPDGKQDTLPSRLLLLGTRLGLEAGAMAELRDRIEQEWREWCKILKLETERTPSSSEVPALEQRCNPDDASDGVRGRPDPLRTLVVDDDPAVLHLLSKTLKGAGYEVFTAHNGKEALELALKLSPQLIVTDWVMPEMDGISLCKALRETRLGRNAYLMILTGCEDEQRLVEALDAGADDYVVKPFNARLLAARLRARRRIIELQEEIHRDREEIRRFTSELSLANRRLQQAALVDSLTELPNRRYAMDRFEQEWSAAERNGAALSCMLIDADRFKEINDTYGHQVGDEVLRHLARVLKRNARATDVICRLGGEEFLVLSPDTGIDAAYQCAERLRNAVAGTPILVQGNRLAITISIGIASRDETTSGPEALMKLADQAVYLAKRNGRNRTCIARP